MGRKIQKRYGKKEQDIITVPLLEGTDGVHKMSKSLGNYIGITEEPNEMLSKIMSIPDSLIIKYYRLLTDVSEEKIEKMQAEMRAGKINPRDAKLCLAHDIVKIYHSEEKAAAAEKYFIAAFSKREIPENIPEVKVEKEEIKLTELLVLAGAAKSLSDARRKIEQGGVEIDGQRVDNWKEMVYSSSDGSTLKTGRHFFRIKF